MQTTYNEFIPLVSQLNHFDKLRLAQWLINTITIEEGKKTLSIQRKIKIGTL